MYFKDGRRHRNLEFLDKYVHFRKHISFRKYNSPKTPEVYNAFDWIFERDQSITKNKAIPEYVLCVPRGNNLDLLFKEKDKLSNIVLVVAGTDKNLSEVLEKIEQFIPYTRKILYEAKDIDHSYIKSFSMGFIDYYINRIEEQDLNYGLECSIKDYHKKQGILASWGGLFGNLDNTLAERKQLVEWLETQKEITREDLSPNQYIQRMVESKYFLCPRGSGIQSPKLAEAILMRTIPIAIKNPCFYDIKNSGIPMILLDQWDDLDDPNILIGYENTYQNINWNEVCQKLTIEYFVENLKK